MSDTSILNLPTFICIGAQRAGTTWLYHCLKEHPEIYMPEHKELRFFNYNYDIGIEAYSKNFDAAGEYKVIGEITPDYYRQEYALERIKNDIPGVKLIFILRNPVERAYSQYQLYFGSEFQEMPFRETYLKHPELVEWGKYGKHLEFIYENFDKKNVLVLDYEVLKSAPHEFLRQIYKFLKVSEDFVPDNLAKSYNKVIYPKAQKILGCMRLSFIVDLIKRSFIGNWIRDRQNKAEIVMEQQDFDYLSDQFAEDVYKLSKIMGTDYSKWLQR